MPLHLHRGVVDAQRVIARSARLHLELRVVDPRLEIEEEARQMRGAQPPILPKGKGEETGQHRPHAEIEETRGRQAAHTGIHHRVARLPRRPSLKRASS